MKEIVNAIAVVNQAFLKRGSSCYLKKTYFSKQLAKRLIITGLVDGIQCVDARTIVLSLKTIGASAGAPLSIKTCSTSSQVHFLSAYTLKSLVFKNRRKLFILSIPEKGGFFSHEYCIKKNIGGLLIGVMAARD